MNFSVITNNIWPWISYKEGRTKEGWNKLYLKLWHPFITGIYRFTSNQSTSYFGNNCYEFPVLCRINNRGLPISFVSNGISFPWRTWWRMRSWVQDPLGACIYQKTNCQRHGDIALIDQFPLWTKFSYKIGCSFRL